MMGDFKVEGSNSLRSIAPRQSCRKRQSIRDPTPFGHLVCRRLVHCAKHLFCIKRGLLPPSIKSYFKDDLFVA